MIRRLAAQDALPASFHAPRSRRRRGPRPRARRPAADATNGTGPERASRAAAAAPDLAGRGLSRPATPTSSPTRPLARGGVAPRPRRSAIASRQTHAEYASDEHSRTSDAGQQRRPGRAAGRPSTSAVGRELERVGVGRQDALVGVATTVGSGSAAKFG